LLLTWLSSDPALLVHLERQLAGGAAWSVMGEVSGQSYADMGLSRRTTYCYRVRYVAGMVWSNTVCGTTPKN
jgi:hypothetical protein